LFVHDVEMRQSVDVQVSFMSSTNSGPIPDDDDDDDGLDQRLRDAAVVGDSEEVQRLIGRGANVNRAHEGKRKQKGKQHRATEEESGRV